MIRGNYTGLRAVEFSDLEKMRNWRNHPEFRKNFREHRELNLQNQSDWFIRTSANSGDFMFIIIDLETNEEIGACGLLYTNWIIRSSDFSFYIGKDLMYIDEKYALDAAKSLIDYGFNDLNLNKIWMELYEFDEKKMNFFQNYLGFRIDGKLRQNAFSEGKYWDSYIISLLSSEFNHL
jgi:RimJ/RimL family protein N-acetyltransferase